MNFETVYLPEELSTDMLRTCLSALDTILGGNSLTPTSHVRRAFIATTGLSLILTALEGNKALVLDWVEQTLDTAEITCGPLEGN